jgi:ABC-type multidrug transport system ATPase subunit
VEATASDIALISNGRLIEHARPETLLQQVEDKVWEMVVPSEALPALKQRAIVGSTTRRSDGVHARVVADERPGDTAVPDEPTLEDAYLSIVEGNGRV